MDKVYFLTALTTYGDEKVIAACSTKEKAEIAKKLNARYRFDDMDGVCTIKEFIVDDYLKELTAELEDELKKLTECQKLHEELKKLT